jgi:hypothetical protein
MATINTIDGGPSHEREGPSFVLVRGVERATGSNRHGQLGRSGSDQGSDQR